MKHRLSKIVRIIFERVPVERILCENEAKRVYYDRLEKEYIQDLVLTYYTEFSDTEFHLQLDELERQMEESVFNSEVLNEGYYLNGFNALFYYIQDILIFYENRVVCKYQELLEWNCLVRAIGEDLPVVCRIAMQDDLQGTENRNFSWRPVIDHNNKQLKYVLNKGIADNHFHLRGSAPYFDIAWLNLMNIPSRNKFWKYFAKIERNYRDKNNKSEVGFYRYPLRVQVLQAVLIRLYLCMKMQNIPFDVLSESEDEVLNKVTAILYNPYRLEVVTEDIQTFIDSLSKYGKSIDYMLNFSPNEYFRQEEEYRILSGERWFLYKMVKGILENNILFNREEYNLFYAYLRIKNEMRKELLLSNEMLGFENFSIYQSRKDYFTHVGNWDKDEMVLARLAIRTVLNNPAVRFLEARISPGSSIKENLDNIRQYDSAIMRAYSEYENLLELIEKIKSDEIQSEQRKAFGEKDLRRRFCYVIHFPKMQDDVVNEDICLECRHYRYRKQIKRKAEILLEFRKTYPEYGRRIVGIDACAMEIGCRPEVFGWVFRVLKNTTEAEVNPLYGERLPQLKITYHVGEDFLDVADGLRAIDEAIRFLQLDYGDRLGHALALGVDVRKWYTVKKNQIVIELQDHLDNIAWLHHQLIRYEIPNMSSLLGWLEEQYSIYFSYIYRECVGYMSRASQQTDFGTEKVDSRFQGKFDITTYYLSMLLRGDDPELYKSGKMREKAVYEDIDLWAKYARNNVKMRSDDIRNIPEVSLLYYTYHYDVSVRKYGRERKTVTIHSNYIEGVSRIQEKMREDIVRRGISIEMNPSSNIRISAFHSYEEHPIKTLYNLGLSQNENELLECPQMNVSINTDDQGVFSTRIENEYALLACAMEKEETNDGKMKYKREFVYKWLDNIREMGIGQAFVNEEEV